MFFKVKKEIIMINFFDQSILDKQRISMSENELIKYCIQKHSSFEFMFQNKFLKYEFNKIDESDIDFINELVSDSVSIQLKQYIEELDVSSIKEILALVTQNTCVAKELRDKDISVDELTNDLSEGVEPKITVFLKIMKVFGITVQNKDCLYYS